MNPPGREARQLAVLSIMLNSVAVAKTSAGVNPAHEAVIVSAGGLNERSALVKLFPDILRKCGFTATHYQGNVAPFIELPPTEDGLLQGGGHTRGYNYRRKVKRLREKFNASVELYRYETDDVKGAVEMFSSIHGGRWKSLGHPSAFEDEALRIATSSSP